MTNTLLQYSDCEFLIPGTGDKRAPAARFNKVADTNQYYDTKLGQALAWSIFEHINLISKKCKKKASSEEEAF